MVPVNGRRNIRLMTELRAAITSVKMKRPSGPWPVCSLLHSRWPPIPAAIWTTVSQLI